MSASRHVAVDLGASGGRVALGTVEGGRLTVEVLHRFPNGGVPIRGGLYWDVVGLWREVLHGLRLAGEGGPVSSVGVDSWAVDFALLDERGHLMDGVRHYRDPRTDGVMEAVLERFPRDALFEFTGLQFLPFNTVYQLLAVKRDAPELLERASTLLMVPDLLHYWLTGRTVTERTNASTTQLLDPRTGDWSRPVLEALELPAHFLPAVVEPGTVLGPLLPEVAKETGLEGAAVVAVGTHDTASAVAAVPAEGEGWAYVSSGTWSLVGVETRRPVINAEALAANLTNEAGVNGTNRLLKNVMGLWLLQECRRAWGEPPWEALYREVEAAGPARAVVNPDDPRFLALGADMPERLRAFCLETGQRPPESRGEVTRCVLESLALKYALVLQRLEVATGTPIRTLYVVGGGGQVELLNQLAADATGLPVVVGPTDATLVGNLLVQAEATGSIRKGTGRAVARASFEPRTYAPGPPPASASSLRAVLERGSKRTGARA